MRGSREPGCAGSLHFVKLARTITTPRAGIVVMVDHGLSNARVEAINTPGPADHAASVGFRTPTP
jgi:transposase